MLSRVKQFLDKLRANPRNTPIRRTFARLHFDVLETREVPATASGIVSGSAFVDSNSNGIFDASDVLVPGAPITLTGTTATIESMNVNVTAYTDQNGAFRFDNVLPGNCSLQAGPIGTLLNGSATLGVVSAPAGVVINTSESLTQGFAVTGNVAPSAISLLMFLNTNPTFGSALGTAGSGTALANHRPNNTPIESATPLANLPSVSPITNSAPTITKIDLAGKFTDADYTNSQVTFQIRFNGEDFAITVDLFDAQTPQTVANFLDYVKSDKYDNSIFHRLASSPFVLQGGGVKPTITGGGLSLDNIDTGGFTVPGEPSSSRSNTFGTLAMALSGDPANVNSGNSQFYFNAGNNAASLDSQNFTVFGRVADVQSENALRRLGSAQVENRGGIFTQIPVVNVTGTFPDNTTLANYMTITDVKLKQDEFLTYTAISSNPALVRVLPNSDHNEQLVLDYPSGQGVTGTATITVTATDRYGASVTKTFDVTVV